MNLSLASPDWFWMGLIAIPIIACYLLRIQPRRYEVSTLIFWDNVIQDTKRRAWWQSLRRWLSLLLQLLFAALLIGAMLDPIFGRSEKARDVVLVIDRSASMNAAVDVTASDSASTGQTRLDAALERAKSLASGLRGGDTMAVIAAGGTVEVVAGRGDFAPAIVEAIDSVRPSDGPSRIDDAIRLARRIAPEDQRRQIIVLTDQTADPKTTGGNAEQETGNNNTVAVDDPTGNSGAGSAEADDTAETTDLFFETQGESRNNWAITAMAVRRSLADPVGFSTRITVQRFVDEPDETGPDPEVRLNLRLISFQELDQMATTTAGESRVEPEGQLVDVFPINMEPGEESEFTWTTEATSAAGGVLVAALDFGKNSQVDDAIASDNVARAIVPPRPDVPVRIVAGESAAEPNAEADDETPADDAGLFFLRSVLQSIPTLKLLEEGEELPPGGLTVWYRLNEVPSELPDGPLLVLAPAANGPPADGSNGSPAWTLGDPIEAPIVATTSETSPLMRHVRMTNVTLGDSRQVDVASGFGINEPLVQTAGDETVAMAIEPIGDAAGNRILILSTELGTSDFPLRIAFPVMMTNAVNWFTGRDAECPAPVRAGVPSDAKVSGQPGMRLSGERVTVATFDSKTLQTRSVVPMRDETVSLQAIASVGLARITPADGSPKDVNGSPKDVELEAGSDQRATDSGRDSPSVEAPLDDGAVAETAATGGWVAVNLCDPVESDTRIGESTESETEVSFASGSSPWFYLVMVALALIVTEWGLFQRRIVE